MDDVIRSKFLERIPRREGQGEKRIKKDHPGRVIGIRNDTRISVNISIVTRPFVRSFVRPDIRSLVLEDPPHSRV